MTRIAATIVFLITSTITHGQDVVTLSPANCEQGLYPQPPGGPFSLFLFCDGALGVNVGVVNTSGAAGPGRIELPQPKIWDKWYVNNRFWQDSAWATDVTSFAWSTDLKHLFIATSGIYGTASVYKLNLPNRTHEKLYPDATINLDSNYQYVATINHINSTTNSVSLVYGYFDDSGDIIDARVLEVK